MLTYPIAVILVTLLAVTVTANALYWWLLLVLPFVGWCYKQYVAVSSIHRSRPFARGSAPSSRSSDRALSPAPLSPKVRVRMAVGEGAFPSSELPPDPRLDEFPRSLQANLTTPLNHSPRLRGPVFDALAPAQSSGQCLSVNRRAEPEAEARGAGACTDGGGDARRLESVDGRASVASAKRSA